MALENVNETLLDDVKDSYAKLHQLEESNDQSSKLDNKHNL